MMIKILILSKAGGLQLGRPFHSHIFFNKAFLVLGHSFLSQTHADRKSVRTRFLKIVSARTYVCVCVCVSTPGLLITRGIMWCDIDPI